MKALYKTSKNNPVISFMDEITQTDTPCIISSITDYSGKDPRIDNEPARVGNPSKVVTTCSDKTISVEQRITSTYDPNLLGLTKPGDLKQAWYDESRGQIEVLPDSKVDTNKNTVTATTNHNSIYFLVDTAKLTTVQVCTPSTCAAPAWTEDFININRPVDPSGQPGDVDIVFLIDDSSSMYDSDKGNFRFTGVYNTISTKLNDNDGFAVINYSDSTQTMVDFTLKGNVTDWTNIQSNIKSIFGGGTNITGALNNAVSLLTSLPSNGKTTMKKIVLLTDGEDPSFDPASYENAKKNNIIIDTIGLSYDETTGNYNKDLLMKIAQETGGEYHFYTQVN